MSKAKFTMKEREEIVRDHMGKFDGVFKAAEFVEAAKVPDHPAHEWFDWDKEGAAYKYWLHQARLFSSVKIKVASLEPVGGWKKTEVEPIRVDITKTLPLLVSPVGGRSEGGGYVYAISEADSGPQSLLEEAALMLSQWRRRFNGILTDQESKQAARLLASLTLRSEENPAA